MHWTSLCPNICLFSVHIDEIFLYRSIFAVVFITSAGILASIV